jgi:hypothetical protein
MTEQEHKGLKAPTKVAKIIAITGRAVKARLMLHSHGYRDGDQQIRPGMEKTFENVIGNSKNVVDHVQLLLS